MVKIPSEQKALLKRFDSERNIDKQRIEQLSNVLFTLKKCSEDGQLSDFIEQRNVFKQSMRYEGSNQTGNRFAGLEDHDAQVTLHYILSNFILSLFHFCSYFMLILSRNLIGTMPDLNQKRI